MGILDEIKRNTLKNCDDIFSHGFVILEKKISENTYHTTHKDLFAIAYVKDLENPISSKTAEIGYRMLIANGIQWYLTSEIEEILQTNMIGNEGFEITFRTQNNTYRVTKLAENNRQINKDGNIRTNKA